MQHSMAVEMNDSFAKLIHETLYNESLMKKIRALALKNCMLNAAILRMKVHEDSLKKIPEIFLVVM